MSGLRLLAGPDLGAGREGYADHVRRLGQPTLAGRALTEALVRSGLTGRGGASFPAGLKWRALASASKGPAIIVVNGAESEPQSHKDRLLMITRPHLVLDGAFLAARTLRAASVVVYVGEEHRAAYAAMERALHEPHEAGRRITRVMAAPHPYVAGAPPAAVAPIQAGGATTTTRPPHSRERGDADARAMLPDRDDAAPAYLC